MTDFISDSVLDDVRQLIDGARAHAAAAVNAELTMLYWQVGRRAFDDMVWGARTEYGRGWSE
jgi:hypothetical protein